MLGWPRHPKSKRSGTYEEWCAEMNSHEKAFEAQAHIWNAFAEAGSEQKRFCFAADYIDCAFRCYYICGAKRRVPRPAI